MAASNTTTATSTIPNTMDVKEEADDETTETRYESLGCALDAMDMGIKVDPGHLRELAAKSIGKFESELTFETADGNPFSIDFPCPKNPGHPSFTPVSKFKPEDIPVNHRTKEFYDTILSWADLVVRVVVKRISRNRPEVYSDTMATFPMSDNRLKGTTRRTRYGSGYVVSTFGPNQPYSGQFCPCHLCRDSGQRREFYSLNIATVTHVIYDSSEARDSVFEFFYDSDDKKGVDYMYGVDSFEQVGKNTEKICIVRCVTHDRSLYRRLMKILTYHHSMITRGETIFENDPTVLISHPHGKCKCITIGHVSDFTVPTGGDFPVNRPISFTTTTECRLPMLPWTDNPTSTEISTIRSEEDENKFAPLPSPISNPSDMETFFEAHGFFVINTGKTQNILSPGMYKRESDNTIPKSDSYDDHLPNESNEITRIATIAPNDDDDIEHVLENFYEWSNFRCLNVDNSSVFTMGEFYFGNPIPARDMRLEGLKKSPYEPEPVTPSKLNMQLIMTAGNAFGPPINDAPSSTINFESNIGKDHSNSIESEIRLSDDHFIERSTKSVVLVSNTQRVDEKELIKSDLQEQVAGNKENNNSQSLTAATNETFENSSPNETVTGNGDTKGNPMNSESLSEKYKYGSSEESRSLDESSYESNSLNEENSEKENSEMKINATNNVRRGVTERSEDGKTETSKPDHNMSDLCSGATADLSIPEMLQILVDKGINLFPENEGDEKMSSMDMMNQLLLSVYAGDSVPLLSTLSKIYEEVARKNTKPLNLALIDPGTQSILPEGMTFTLPKRAKFALRFHDINSSWLSFPPGTTFHTSEGQYIPIPPDAEFSFKCRSVVQGFMTYRMDSCPGSSGGVVLLGRGRFHAGHVAHSGQVDGRYNRSSLRRWFIYLS